MPGKARPVLVVSDRLDPRLGELIALRLLRLGALTSNERETVRSQDGSWSLLPRPRAVRPAPQWVGRLGQEELRVAHERLATYYGLDLRLLVRGGATTTRGGATTPKGQRSSYPLNVAGAVTGTGQLTVNTSPLVSGVPGNSSS